MIASWEKSWVVPIDDMWSRGPTMSASLRHFTKIVFLGTVGPFEYLTQDEKTSGNSDIPLTTPLTTVLWTGLLESQLKIELKSGLKKWAKVDLTTVIPIKSSETRVFSGFITISKALYSLFGCCFLVLIVAAILLWNSWELILEFMKSSKSFWWTVLRLHLCDLMIISEPFGWGPTSDILKLGQTKMLGLISLVTVRIFEKFKELLRSNV